MKTITLIMLLVIASLLSAQNWTSVKETNINVNNATSVDIFTNKFGNHIIVQESNALKYYKMNLSGSAGSAVTLDSSSVVSPSIAGDASRIYVVYRRSSESSIRIKYSSDGGTNWSDLSNLNYNGSYIESVFSNEKLHVTYELSNVVYHAFYNTINPGWSSPATVSTSETGNYPRITAYYTSNEDKVFFLYQNTSSVKKWREYNVTSSSWGNINQAFNIDYSGILGLSVDATYIYFVLTYMDNQYDNRLMFYTNYRSNNNNYDSFDEVSSWGIKCFNTITSDGESHIPVYWYYSGEEESYDPAIYRKKGTANPYNWDQIYYHASAQPPTVLNVSNSSNDVHVIWRDNLGNSSGQNLRYKYDDQAPLAPQNLAVTSNQYDEAVLSWDANQEIDMYDGGKYKIYRGEVIGSGEPSTWTLVATIDAYSGSTPVTSWTDTESLILMDKSRWLHYKITAYDKTYHESAYSNKVKIPGKIPKISTGNGKSLDYKYALDQSFPNPFNPTTKISYSLQKEGFVTIKVYGVLGNEVAVLVNEVKPEGNHEIEFNANNLPSGIYIYKMQSGKFTAVNKMILMR